MYDYYRTTYEAHERLKRRHREAEAERTLHEARGRRRQRRRAHLTRALQDLLATRQRLRAQT